MLTIDREALGGWINGVLNNAASEFQSRASQRVDTSLSVADSTNPTAVVSSDDPNWAVLEYGTFPVEPDPWALTTLMEMTERNG